jgi:hypothetical protein
MCLRSRGVAFGRMMTGIGYARKTVFTVRLLFISTTGRNNVCPFLRKDGCSSATDACQCACSQDNLGIHRLSPWNIFQP